MELKPNERQVNEALILIPHTCTIHFKVFLHLSLDL